MLKKEEEKRKKEAEELKRRAKEIEKQKAIEQMPGVSAVLEAWLVIVVVCFNFFTHEYIVVLVWHIVEEKACAGRT